MFACKCCQKLEDENKYLRGLVDRMMEKVAPKVEEIDPRIEKANDAGEDDPNIEHVGIQ